MLNILITCGPTWVPIDSVRVISNISSGKTGLEITKQALKHHAKVTLLLGPITENFNLKNPNLKLIRFKYFDELFSLIKKELLTNKYDAVIHLAAVSDYKVKNIVSGKIKSNKKTLTLELIPTPKIVSLIKKYDPKVLLVQFKLEAGLTKNNLLTSVYKDLIKNNADLVVANDLAQIGEKRHIAYIIDRNKNIRNVTTKKALAVGILKTIVGTTLCGCPK